MAGRGAEVAVEGGRIAASWGDTGGREVMLVMAVAAGRDVEVAEEGGRVAAPWGVAGGRLGVCCDARGLGLDVRGRAGKSAGRRTGGVT